MALRCLLGHPLHLYFSHHNGQDNSTPVSMPLAPGSARFTPCTVHLILTTSLGRSMIINMPLRERKLRRRHNKRQSQRPMLPGKLDLNLGACENNIHTLNSSSRSHLGPGPWFMGFLHLSSLRTAGEEIGDLQGGADWRGTCREQGSFRMH